MVKSDVGYHLADNVYRIANDRREFIVSRLKHYLTASAIKCLHGRLAVYHRGNYLSCYGMV